jgi:hypothetical protein
MRALLLIVVVLLLGAGLYALTTVGIGGLLSAGRAKADGDEKPFDPPPGTGRNGG